MRKYLVKYNKPIKIAAVLLGLILFVWLQAGSWKLAMQKYEWSINESAESFLEGMRQQEQALVSLYRYTEAKSPDEKKLLTSIKQVGLANRALKIEKSQLQGETDTTKLMGELKTNNDRIRKIAKFSWKQSSLPRDKETLSQLRALYATLVMIKQSEYNLNATIKDYNAKLKRPISGTINFLFYRYEPKQLVGDPVGVLGTLEDFVGSDNLPQDKATRPRPKRPDSG